VKAHPQAGKQHPIEEPGGPQPTRQQAGVNAPHAKVEQRHLDIARSSLYGVMGHLGISVMTDEAVASVASRIADWEAPLGTAPEQADQLVERWEQIAEHGEGTPATDNFYFRCAMERCAAELKAALRAIEQKGGAKVNEGSERRKRIRDLALESGEHRADSNQTSANHPQAAGGAALSAENIKLKIGSRFYDREPYSGAWDEPFNVACEVLNAALAAHDQKVRREVLEEAAHIAEVTWLNRVGPTNEKIKKVFMAIRSLASGSGGEGEVKCG